MGLVLPTSLSNPSPTSNSVDWKSVHWVLPLKLCSSIAYDHNTLKPAIKASNKKGYSWIQGSSNIDDNSDSDNDGNSNINSYNNSDGDNDNNSNSSCNSYSTNDSNGGCHGDSNSDTKGDDAKKKQI